MRPAHQIAFTALLTALTGHPALAEAQQAQQSTAVLEITVRSVEGDRPLSGAQVVLGGIAVAGITNASGELRIEKLPAGTRRLRVTHLGYAPLDEPVTLVTAQSTRVVVHLNIQPIALAPIRVRSGRSLLASRGFYDRQSGGFGTFLTRVDIAAMNPQYMSDVLRKTSGFQVGVAQFGDRPQASIRSNGTSCPIQYFVDGTLAARFNIDEVLPEEVEGLEIYRGASTIPPAFNRGTARCGVILIWTRVH